MHDTGHMFPRPWVFPILVIFPKYFLAAYSTDNFGLIGFRLKLFRSDVMTNSVTSFLIVSTTFWSILHNCNDIPIRFDALCDLLQNPTAFFSWWSLLFRLFAYFLVISSFISAFRFVLPLLSLCPLRAYQMLAVASFFILHLPRDAVCVQICELLCFSTIRSYA